jgi:glycosyltransferase involved in cell wall biosynthesis
MPVVSVGMSMRNAARTLELSLRSILRQSFIDWELILIDDGSTDDSIAIAKRVPDSRIRLIADGAWYGLPARLNQAVALSTGRYFARMDADDIAFPERLARQVAYLETHQDVDLVGSGAIAFGEDGIAIGVFPRAVSHQEIVAQPWVGFPLPHPTWMGRREWFVKWRYREQAVRCEDQDLLLRSHCQSRFACLPEVLLGYRQPAVSARNVWLGRRHLIQAVWEYGIRHRRPILALRGVLSHAYRAATVLAALGLGQGDSVLKRRFQPASEGELQAWQHCFRAVVHA